jgi:hypothetical protein
MYQIESWVLVLLLFAVSASPGLGRLAPTERGVAACTRNLQAIGRSLEAYQRDYGELPPHLSDLRPKYLKDKLLFHCPNDPSPGKPGFEGAAADPKLSISYSYEMSTDRTSVRCFLLGPRPPGMTWREQKAAQRVNFGDRVPVIRCWYHTDTRGGNARPIVLNLTLSGQVFRSQGRWELEADTVAAVLACMERDVAMGAETFRRRWRAPKIVEYLEAVPPTPALRDRCRMVASKMAALA